MDGFDIENSLIFPSIGLARFGSIFPPRRRFRGGWVGLGSVGYGIQLLCFTVVVVVVVCAFGFGLLSFVLLAGYAWGLGTLYFLGWTADWRILEAFGGYWMDGWMTGWHARWISRSIVE